MERLEFRRRVPDAPKPPPLSPPPHLGGEAGRGGERLSFANVARANLVKSLVDENTDGTDTHG
jgi:hypothetical protein